MVPSSIEKSCYVYKDIWSNKNIKKPEEVYLNSHKKYNFYCSKCFHIYEQSPKNKNNGQGCPYCSNRKLCGTLDCSFCLSKSCYKYKDIWSDKNIKNPEEVALNSHKKYFFNCLDCFHTYEQAPEKKTLQGSSCSYCTNGKLCGILDCSFCLSKSCYKYKDIWSDKNIKNPEEVYLNSQKKYYFECSYCSHTYEQLPFHKTRQGSGCPLCINKTERKVADFLKEFNIEFISQFKINSKKRYDFYFPEFKLILEVDGRQHFMQVSNWGCPKKTLENDIQKMSVALENGYSVVRIYQPDIFNDVIDWRQTILSNMFSRTVPSITCVSSNPEIYNRHKEN